MWLCSIYKVVRCLITFHLRDDEVYVEKWMIYRIQLGIPGRLGGIVGPCYVSSVTVIYVQCD